MKKSNLTTILSITIITFFLITGSSFGEDALYVDPDGNVGIGTTNPEASLHVVGSNFGSATVKGVSLGSSSEYASMELKGASSTVGGGYIDFGYPSNDYRGRIMYINSTNKMYFYTGGTTTAELVLSDGKVGIATSPSTELTVYGTKGIQWSDNSAPWRLGRYSDDIERTSYVYFTKGTGNGYQNLAAGKVYSGSYMYAYDYYYNSDEKLKKNIQPISNALDKVLQLNGINFEWEESGDKSIGVIAQDVEKVFPELVRTESDGIKTSKTVAYGNLVAPLIEAVKELKAENDSLIEMIEELENRIDNLEKNQ